MTAEKAEVTAESGAVAAMETMITVLMIIMVPVMVLITLKMIEKVIISKIIIFSSRKS